MNKCGPRMIPGELPCILASAQMTTAVLAIKLYRLISVAQVTIKPTYCIMVTAIVRKLGKVKRNTGRVKGAGTV